MEPLDGLYRHGGAVITWDRDGVTLVRGNETAGARVRWQELAGARRVGLGSGYVQLLLQGREATADYRADRFAFAVNSDQDANRLLTTLRWYAAAPRQRASSDDLGE